VLAPGDQLAIPFAQAHLHLPADGLDFSRRLLQTELKMAADLRRIPIGPGAFDERGLAALLRERFSDPELLGPANATEDVKVFLRSRRPSA